jgi:hypothetical protein
MGGKMPGSNQKKVGKREKPKRGGHQPSIASEKKPERDGDQPGSITSKKKAGGPIGNG